MKKPTKKVSSKIAYVLEDVVFGAFEVRASANAWWTDRVKLNALITSFKYGVNIKEACVLGGISEDQYKYFKQVHPDFSPIIDMCRSLPGLRARKTIIEALDTDLATARWYLERKHADEFGRVKSEYGSRPSLMEYIAADREKYQ